MATLAAAAAQLQTAAEEAVSKEGTPRSDQQLPAGEAVEGTPSAGAPRMERLDSPATPWVPQIGVEAAAIAAALAASRSATPASAPGSPAAARATPGRRCAPPAEYLFRHLFMDNINNTAPLLANASLLGVRGIARPGLGQFCGPSRRACRCRTQDDARCNISCLLLCRRWSS